MEFNDTQKEIIKWKDGNLLVTAGAGSGKTAVFVARIGYLIKGYGVNPDNILALTFTKNASEQMRKRLSGIVGAEMAKRVTMSTFHSFAYSMMRRYVEGYDKKQIVHDWFRLRTLEEICAEKSYKNEYGLDLKMSSTELGAFISYQKSNLIKPYMEVIVDDKVPFAKKDIGKLQDAYSTYCKVMINNNVIDFDDMIADFSYELTDNDEFREMLKSKYKYILIDEFQDTNVANTYILQQLCEDNLMAVGDVNQSIYSFINADVTMILDFDKNFGNVTLKRLDNNYRSGKNIIDLANKIMSGCPDEDYKKLAMQNCTRTDFSNCINFITFQNEFIEAEYIVNKVKTLIGEDVKPKDIAIISRTNATLGYYESVFADHNIKVDISSTKSFFDRKEIMDVLAYARYILDTRDSMSLQRVINVPNRFISKKIIEQINSYSYSNGATIEDGIRHYSANNRHLTEILHLLSQLRDNLDLPASKFIRFIVHKTQMIRHIEHNSKSEQEKRTKIESIEKLYSIADRFNSIDKFLNHIKIVQMNSKTESEDAVKLLTVHASKGLEFENVFGVSISDKSFPHQMSYNYEEERRLLYVLVTRAKDNLYLSGYVFENNGDSLSPTPFLSDVIGESFNKSHSNVLSGSDMSMVRLVG